MKDKFITVHIYGGGGSRLPFIMGAAETISNKYPADYYIGNSAGAITSAIMREGLEVERLVNIFSKVNIFNAYSSFRKYLELSFIPDNVSVQCTDLVDPRPVIINSRDCYDLENYKKSIIASASVLPIAKAQSVRLKDSSYSKLVDGGYWYSIPRSIDTINHIQSIHPNKELRVILITSYPPISLAYPSNRWKQYFRARSIDKNNKVLQDVDIFKLMNIKEFIHIKPSREMPSMFTNNRKQTYELYKRGCKASSLSV